MIKEHPIWLIVVLVVQLLVLAFVGGAVVAGLIHAIDAALLAVGMR